MSVQDFSFLILSILGGVALFIVGMNIMTDGLRQAAGERLRSILNGATRNRCAGVGFGTLLGFLIHSTAATVMMVGFVNAGLMTLVNAIPLLMGASIGTTLSMQLISFQLAEYAFLAIGVGFLVQISVPRPVLKNLGRAVVGFGMLFLAMDFLGGVIEPYREELAPWLAQIDGRTWSGMFLGILAATIVTALIQSSGATIGMLFAMIAAGVFTSLEQIYPIVLGAHIGTATTALMVSIGANLEARRAALANLLFQLFNVALAIAAAPLFLRLIAATSDDLVRQAANLHTAVMVGAVVVLLPATQWFAGFVTRATPSRSRVPEKSHLDRETLRRPEKALRAAILELGRALQVSRENFDLARHYVFSPTRHLGQRISMNEKIVNEIKPAVKDYLSTLTHGYLSRRQALMIQYLNHSMADIERIADHIESLRDVRDRQAREGAFELDGETVKTLSELFRVAGEVLDKLSRAFANADTDFHRAGKRILEGRDRFDHLSMKAKANVNERVAGHELHPLIGLFFSDYVSALDRIVKHAKMIARELEQPFFRFKPQKLDREIELPKEVIVRNRNVPEPPSKPGA